MLERIYLDMLNYCYQYASVNVQLIFAKRDKFHINLTSFLTWVGLYVSETFKKLWTNFNKISCNYRPRDKQLGILGNDLQLVSSSFNHYGKLLYYAADISCGYPKLTFPTMVCKKVK